MFESQDKWNVLSLYIPRVKWMEILWIPQLASLQYHPNGSLTVYSYCYTFCPLDSWPNRLFLPDGKIYFQVSSGRNVPSTQNKSLSSHWGRRLWNGSYSISFSGYLLSGSVISFISLWWLLTFRSSHQLVLLEVFLGQWYGHLWSRSYCVKTIDYSIDCKSWQKLDITQSYMMNIFLMKISFSYEILFITIWDSETHFDDDRWHRVQV